mmetsp:Transcript_66385/g.167306  ORF Transcript_66385/g.167306 Transcript_66385/m.167306 type:complete len:219 (-) Transcript_66385:859-1515(-)
MLPEVKHAQDGLEVQGPVALSVRADGDHRPSQPLRNTQQLLKLGHVGRRHLVVQPPHVRPKDGRDSPNGRIAEGAHQPGFHGPQVCERELLHLAILRAFGDFVNREDLHHDGRLGRTLPQNPSAATELRGPVPDGYQSARHHGLRLDLCHGLDELLKLGTFPLLVVGPGAPATLGFVCSCHNPGAILRCHVHIQRHIEDTNRLTRNSCWSPLGIPQAA